MGPFMKKYDPKKLGYVGECYVSLELAKRGIYVCNLNDCGFDYDLILNNGLKVEVKSYYKIKDKWDSYINNWELIQNG